jgi:branched-subunit amino acid transport protein
MTKSKSIWIVALLLLGSAAYLASADTSEYGWLPFYPLAVLSAVCAVGLVYETRWCQYLAYGIFAYVILVWSYLVFQVAGSNWPYPNVIDSAFSLAPGAALVAVCVGSIFAVRKHFRIKSGPYS